MSEMTTTEAIAAIAEVYHRFDAQERERRASTGLGPTLEAFYRGRSAGIADALAVLLGTDQEGAVRWLGVDLDRT